MSEYLYVVGFLEDIAGAPLPGDGIAARALGGTYIDIDADHSGVVSARSAADGEVRLRLHRKPGVVYELTSPGRMVPRFVSCSDHPSGATLYLHDLPAIPPGGTEVVPTVTVVELSARIDALAASVGSGGGVTDHGALTGLGGDDHPQYLTAARGDALVGDAVEDYLTAQLADPASEASGAVHTAATEAAASTVAAKVDRGALVLDVRDYGLKGDGTIESVASLYGAIKPGVTVYWPAPSVRYELPSPLPDVSNVTHRGDGMSTVLRWSASAALAPSSTVTGLRFQGLGLETGAAGGHVIDISQGGLTFTVFDGCELRSRNGARSSIFVSGARNFFAVTFRDCKLWRMPDAAAPAIDIIAGGSGINNVAFRGGQWHGQGNTLTPFFRADVTAPAIYISEVLFDGILGEQNMGGLIDFAAPNGVSIRNVVDYDASGAYQGDLIRLAFATGGTGPRACTIEGCGTSGTATFATGKAHLAIATHGGGTHIGRIRNGGTAPVLAIADAGRVIQHGGGLASSYAYTTDATTTVGVYDSLIVVNRAAGVVTLPDPAALLSFGTIPKGRTYTVKNINAAAATVNSAGAATIDGVASVSLPQWGVLRVVTDGTNWLMI